MNILYIGAGFVGACSAAVSADSGHQTLVYDIDEQKIAALGSGDRDTIEECLYEVGLGETLVRNAARITFTSEFTRVVSFLDTCDAVFLCLPTPEIGETGESNLSYYRSAVETLAASLAKRNGGAQEQYVVIVNKSTVPIDMVDETMQIMTQGGVKNIGVVSNPEFLVEGKAMKNALKPDRVVIGAWQEADFAVMRNVYKRFVDSPDAEYIEVNPKEAAAGKLLANFYLFNKLAVCFDVIGRTCETFDNLSYEAVKRILISDDRIGTWGFYDSLYAGGSCFIKDARSLSHQLQSAGANAEMVNETYQANHRQLERFIGRAKEEAGVDWKGKKVALLGLAFKRDTNDVRNSPSVTIAQILSSEGASEIRAYDPAAYPMFRSVVGELPPIREAKTEQEAIDGADVLIIATDWPQFRELTTHLLAREQPRGRLLMDGRRMLAHRYTELAAYGYTIIPVGGPLITNHDS